MAEQLVLTVDDLYWGDIKYTPYIAKIFLEVYNDEGEAQYFANLELQPTVLLEEYNANPNDVEYAYKAFSIKDNINGFKLTVKTPEQLLTILLNDHVADLFWEKIKNMTNTIRILLRENELEDITILLNDSDNPIEF